MNFLKRFEKIIEISRDVRRTLPTLGRALKVGEEYGEFAEAVLYKLGYLKHKVMKEPPEGEAADLYITVLDTLADIYKKETPAQVLERLNTQLKLKTLKWMSIQQPEDMTDEERLMLTPVEPPAETVVKPNEAWPFPTGNRTADRVVE